MARKKKLTAYPKEYFKIFEVANERAVVIQHETVAQAEATRNDLYTFRSVLYHSPDHEELAAAAQNVRLSLTGPTLTAEPIRQVTVNQEKQNGY